MDELFERGWDSPEDASRRVMEIACLFERVRAVLNQMIEAFGTPNGETPKAVIAKLNELHAVHLKILTAEEAFHARQPKPGTTDETDFTAIRAEIGGQLDRIRAAILADRISLDPD